MCKLYFHEQDYGESERDNMRARLQVCTSFLRLARAGDVAMLPHMQVGGNVRFVAYPTADRLLCSGGISLLAPSGKGDFAIFFLI